MSETNIEIIEAKTKKDLRTFIEVPFHIYSANKFFSPQLIKEQLIHFSHSNPFFKHAEVSFFVAYKDYKLVGRVASIINYRHIEYHKEDIGFFGFFESINDYEVSSKLLDTVCDIFRRRNLKAIRGPMNFSTNEECGFLCEGYNIPSMIMTPYNPPYYNDLMESYGMKRVKDLYAFILKIPDEIPEKIYRIAALAEKKGIKTRTIKTKNDQFREDMLFFKDVYNSAWQDNWGFIPITEDELFYSAKRLKKIIVPELTILAFDGEKPVGFFGAVPDYNFVLRKIRGKLNLFNIFKAIYYSRKIKSLRLLLFGVKKQYRNRGIDALLLREAFRSLKKTNYEEIEFSWILEDNIATIRIVEIVDAKLYKKFRIYEKNLLSF
ncbi:MAG: GNAT family N-acetyltransferase [Thermodesulfovibrionales bacterium]|nr:GNAT family N-acetyltransferase [Thermodesulfovibrionales bacterium]